MPKSFTVKSNARRDLRKAGLIGKIGVIDHAYYLREEVKDGRRVFTPVFVMIEPDDVAHFRGLGYDAELKDDWDARRVAAFRAAYGAKAPVPASVYRFDGKE